MSERARPIQSKANTFAGARSPKTVTHARGTESERWPKNVMALRPQYITAVAVAAAAEWHNTAHTVAERRDANLQKYSIHWCALCTMTIT